MKLKRLKGGKGPRWKKGQSCLSNSDKTNFREAAKGRFFQELKGESGLTQDALKKHNTQLAGSSTTTGILLKADDVVEEDYQSVGKSFNTFATNFTTCTIPAFEKFFKNFTVDSVLQTRMLAIHAAAQEYIQEAGLPEISTSYMCALMASLEGVQDSEDDAAATFSLVARVARKVPEGVLVAKFSAFASLILVVLKLHQNSNNNVLLTNAIGCLSIIVRAQPRSEWQYEFTKNIFNVIRQYTLHHDHKIRKSAQYNIYAILKGSAFLMHRNRISDTKMTTDSQPDIDELPLPTFEPHPAADSVGRFVKAELQLASSTRDAKKTLHLLNLCQQVSTCLQEKMLQQMCERILGVMYIGDPLIRTSAMRSFQALFATDKVSALTLDMCVAIFNALTVSAGASTQSLVPNVNDVSQATVWIKVCTSAISKLVRFDRSTALTHAVRWFHQVTLFWKSNSSDIHQEVFFSIEFLIDDLKDQMTLDKLSSDHSAQCVEFFKAVESGASLQYKDAWPYVFRSLSAIFKILGPTLPSETYGPCLKSLSQLYEDPELTHRPLLELVIGSAVSGLGPQSVMEVIPIQITGNVLDDERFFWILPILKRYTKGVELVFFVNYFMHLAEKCSMVVKSLLKSGKEGSVITTTYKQIELQIWALLPCFAEGAKDTEKALAMKEFPKKIRDYIRDREDIRLDLLSGLRNMIYSRGTPSKLGFFAKNFLPVLFNIYLLPLRETNKCSSIDETVDSGQRLAVYDTIKLYLNITEPDRVRMLFTEAVKKYNKEVVEKLKELLGTDVENFKKSEVKKAEFKGRCLLDLFRIHLPYVNHSDLLQVWDIVEPFVKHSKDIRQQKGAYRMLEELLSLETEAGVQFIKENLDTIEETLLNSMKTVAPNARASRLKCFIKVLENLPNSKDDDSLELLLQHVVSEAVICFGGANSAPTRKSAIQLIILVGEVILRFRKLSMEDTFCQTLHMLLAGLATKSSPIIISNTIRALSVVSCKYHYIMPAYILENLLENVGLMLVKDNREITKAALGFVHVMFKMFPPSLTSNYVDNVVCNMLKMSEDCKKKHRMKVRDINTIFVRKFGGDRIKNLVPDNDVIASKCLRNITKLEARKKKGAKKEQEDAESKPERVMPASLDEILEEIDRDIEEDKESSSKKEKGNNKDNKDNKKDNKKKKNKKEMWIKEDDDEVMDLLDSTSGYMSNKPFDTVKESEKDNSEKTKTEEEKYGFKFDKTTKKFIIKDDTDSDEESGDSDTDSDNDIPNLEGLVIDGSGKKSSKKMFKRKRTISEGSEETKVVKPVSKTKKRNNFDYGSEFRSKKAGGDVKSKSGVAPYVYVQLTKEKLNKRKQAKFKGQFKSLVRGAKKGAARGTKMKKKNKK